MSDDIVTRLRAQTIGCDDYNCESCEIETEAADEIERLRKQRNNLAWAIAWFLKGGSRNKLEQRFKDYEETL